MALQNNVVRKFEDVACSPLVSTLKKDKNINPEPEATEREKIESCFLNNFCFKYAAIGKKICIAVIMNDTYYVVDKLIGNNN